MLACCCNAATDAPAAVKCTTLHLKHSAGRPSISITAQAAHPAFGVRNGLCRAGCRHAQQRVQRTGAQLRRAQGWVLQDANGRRGGACTCIPC